MQTQKRGGTFWLWADCLLKTQGHQAQLPRCSIDVQARINRQGYTQMFIGVYGPSGKALCEEFYPHLLEETVEQALSWGVRRCDVLIDQTTNFSAPHRINPAATQSTPSQLINAGEADHRRESFLAASKSAQAEYAEAKAALLLIMRNGNVDSRIRAEHVRRLNAAVDVWVSLPRQYAESRADAVSKRTVDQVRRYDGYLFDEELERDNRGISVSGVGIC